jgi:hypothetical protein
MASLDANFMREAASIAAYSSREFCDIDELLLALISACGPLARKIRSGAAPMLAGKLESYAAWRKDHPGDHQSRPFSHKCRQLLEAAVQDGVADRADCLGVLRSALLGTGRTLTADWRNRHAISDALVVTALVDDPGSRGAEVD